MHIRGFMLFALILSGFVIVGGCTSTTSPSADAIALRILPTGTARPAAGTISRNLRDINPVGGFAESGFCSP